MRSGAHLEMHGREEFLSRSKEVSNTGLEFPATAGAPARRGASRNQGLEEHLVRQQIFTVRLWI